MFATLKDELGEPEKKIIGEFAQWGRERLANGKQRTPVIVLTGLELFADWRISEAWKERGGEHAKMMAPRHTGIRDLKELARLTQQLYLGLPDPFTEATPVTQAAPA